MGINSLVPSFDHVTLPTLVNSHLERYWILTTKGDYKKRVIYTQCSHKRADSNAREYAKLT